MRFMSRYSGRQALELILINTNGMPIGKWKWKGGGGGSVNSGVMMKAMKKK